MNRKVAMASFLIIFAAAAVFGVAVSMMGGGHAMMSGCPFAGSVAALCPMGVIAHVATWGTFFAAIIPLTVGILLLTAVLYFISPALVFFSGLGSFSALSRRLKEHNFLISEFSEGILHPKLYA